MLPGHLSNTVSRLSFSRFDHGGAHGGVHSVAANTKLMWHKFRNVSKRMREALLQVTAFLVLFPDSSQGKMEAHLPWSGE
jgi:hypothetical protein